jgi:hypothetical protein
MSKTLVNAVLLLVLGICCASTTAAADNPAGLYVGGAIGQAQVAAVANSASFSPYGSDAAAAFKENHSAFKVTVGLRSTSIVGAEMAYIDFGHPSESLFNYPSDASIKGAAAFGMLYLPVPNVDLYLKAGAAHLQSRLSGVVPYLPICAGCAPPRFQQDRANTSGAGGAGAQVKFGALAVRAEYERFSAAGGNPSLLSVGVTWSFF